MALPTNIIRMQGSSRLAPREPGGRWETPASSDSSQAPADAPKEIAIVGISGNPDPGVPAWGYHEIEINLASSTDSPLQRAVRAAMVDAGACASGRQKQEAKCGLTGVFLAHSAQASLPSPASHALAPLPRQPNPAALLSHINGFEGPSMILDCGDSSALTAIHLACEGMRAGSLEDAIVADLPCARCGDQPRSIGVLYLKPLKKALADRNPVYAVIKSSVSGHRGRSAPVGNADWGSSLPARRALQMAGLSLLNRESPAGFNSSTRMTNTEHNSLFVSLQPEKPAGGRELELPAPPPCEDHYHSFTSLGRFIRVLLAWRIKEDRASEPSGVVPSPLAPQQGSSARVSRPPFALAGNRAAGESETWLVLASPPSSVFRRPCQPKAMLMKREVLYPLSAGQKGLWFLHQWAPSSHAYHVPAAFRIEKKVDDRLLEQAFQEIVDRHPILWSTIEGEQPEPKGRLYSGMKPPFERLGLPAGGKEVPTDLFHKLIRAPFDLAKGPLARLYFISRAADDHFLLIVAHHLIFDGGSLAILIAELSEIYAARFQQREPNLPPVCASYADFCHWQARMLASPEAERSRAYWLQRLAPPLATLALPTDFPRPALASLEGKIHQAELGGRLLTRLRLLAKQERTSMFSLFLAGFQTLLFRYSGQRDIIVGTPLAGRPRARFEQSMGYFMNMVALRLNYSAEASFQSLAQQNREAVLDAIDHGDFPFPLLTRDLAIEEDQRVTPVFQVCFMLHNWLHNFRDSVLREREKEGPYAAHLGMKPILSVQQTGEYDLTLEVVEMNDSCLLFFKYNPRLFREATLARLARHYENILMDYAHAPTKSPAEVALLSPGERDLMLRCFNQTETTVAPPHLIHQRFLARAAQWPEKTALTHPSSGTPTRHIGYARLSRRVKCLSTLLRSQGVGAETAVGICTHRNAAMVTALLAVLHAGGFYVPLDPSFPATRLAHMIEDSALKIMLVEPDLRLPEMPEHVSRVYLEEDGEPLTLPSIDTLPPVVPPNQLAYVMYTSGSTGLPKGVQISHDAVVNFLSSMACEPGLDERDILVAVTTISFDIAGLELYLPLSVGAHLVIADKNSTTDGHRLARLLACSRATAMQATPATWRLLLAADWPGQAGLKLICGGEALPTVLADRLRGRGAALWNLYGPTETTIWSSASRVFARDEDVAEVADTVSIGHPIANTEIYLVDPRLNPVPVGVAGALLIGGRGLARGYRNRPDLSADRMIPDPFHPGRKGGRLYRTGDLARFDETGQIHFLGRLDQQVKLRGFRIEPGEVESRLLRHPSIDQAVVTPWRRQDGEDQLVAYLVAGATPDSSEPIPGEETLHQWLAADLPPYMIPAFFVFLPSLPLTPNDKIDRRALPEPQPALPASGEASDLPIPQEPVVTILTRMWSRVLEKNQVRPSDHFFRLGGHSLLATRLTSLIRDTLQVELSVQALFQHPTPAQLAAHIQSLLKRGLTGETPLLTTVPRADGLPLSFAQQRLWFLHQVRPDDPAFNIAHAVSLSGQLDPRAFETMLTAIVERHEVLRTTFAKVVGEPYQIIHPPSPLPLPIIDLTRLAPRERERLGETLSHEEAHLPFYLERGPLFRFRLLRLKRIEHLMHLSLHHIAADGWSGSIFIHEMRTLYTALLRGRTALLEPLTLQYADFSVWQRSWFETHREVFLDFWKEQLADLPREPKLPAAFPRTGGSSTEFNTRPFQVPAQHARALETFCRDEDLTLFMALLAAFYLLVHHHTREEDITVGTDVANRNRNRIEGLIGFFVNQLPLRMRLTGGLAIGTLLARVRAMALGAYAHQDMPFDKLVEALSPERREDLSPLFQMKLVLQNAPFQMLALPGLELQALPSALETTKMDLQINLWSLEDGLHGEIHYNAELFDAATIARLLRHFEILIGLLPTKDVVSVTDACERLAESDRRHDRRQLGKLWKSGAQTFKKARMKKTLAG